MNPAAASLIIDHTGNQTRGASFDLNRFSEIKLFAETLEIFQREIKTIKPEKRRFLVCVNGGSRRATSRAQLEFIQDFFIQDSAETLEFFQAGNQEINPCPPAARSARSGGKYWRAGKSGGADAKSTNEILPGGEIRSDDDANLSKRNIG